MKEALETGIKDTTNEISTLEESISTLTTQIAQARDDLIEADLMLKDDKLYMTDLTSLCETRANQWDQRTAMRAGELEALSKAITILTGKVVSADEYSKRALLQTKGGDKKQSRPLTLLQHASVHQHDVSERRAMLEKEHQMHALDLLGAEGHRLQSSKLSALVARAASDPFAKVKNLIQALVERLLEESTAEATKKGFCDTETAK